MKTFLFVLEIAIFAVLIVAAAFIIAVFSLMLIKSNDDNSTVPNDAPVIIPGCKIRGNEPRKTLKNRLDTALVYLKKHDKAPAVVCGGYYGNFTQGYVMKKYLCENGISADRIFVDDSSATTYENMKNARSILKDVKKVYISTNVYHLYRSKFYAKKFGFEPHSLKARTPMSQFWFSWPRELTAVIKAWIVGK